MRFTPTFLDEIRDRVPISSVIGARVSWDRRKTNAAKGDWWACCPFHNEKSPSFHADDRRGRYHCFGCGADGDHFTFLTELEGLAFPEAVERLAAEAGVPLPAPDSGAEARDKRSATLIEVMELACRFFEAELAGKPVRQEKASTARRANICASKNSSASSMVSRKQQGSGSRARMMHLPVSCAMACR